MYLDRSAQHRAMYPVPVKPVLEAVERWLAEEAQRSGWVPGRRNHGFASPMTRLAVRAGMKESSFARTVYRLRNESTRMSLAQAEKLIEATYGDELWGHPQLRRFNPKPRRDTSWMRPDEIVDGEHGIRHWAWRVVKEMSPAERRSVALMDVELIRDVDGSMPARHAGPKRERTEFQPHPYAPLEKAFGADLRGEKAA